MRKLISLLMCIVLLFSVFTNVAIADSGITISVSSKEGYRGDTVEVSVNISAGSAMQAFGFELKYDTKVLELVDAKKGTNLVGSPVINSNLSGKVVFSYAATSSIVASGSVLDLTFKIKENATYGESAVTISVNEFSDGSFSPIPYEVRFGSVTVIAPMLEAVSNISLASASYDEIEIIWDANEAATGYNVYVNGELINDEPITENTYIISELKANTKYIIQVSTLNYLTESKKSDEFEFSTTMANCFVSFVDWDYDADNYVEGSVFKVDSVEYGSSAVAPEDPEREGYKFLGWDTDFSVVTSDLVIYAKYEPITCSVKFVDWDDTVISEQTVGYGQAAIIPELPEREGYIFLYWDKNADKITADVTIKAVYEQEVCKHTNTIVINEVESTCSKNGYSGDTVCSDCGNTISGGGELELADHKYEAEITPPTQDAQGFTTHTCSVCGDSYVDSYTDYIPENSPVIRVEQVRASSGKSVDVKISIENNPGIVNMMLKVSYSNKLKLTAVTDGDVLGSAMHTPNYKLNPYYLTWANDTITSNITANGVIATLTFETEEDTIEGLYRVEVSYDNKNADIVDVNFQTIDFKTVSGGVEIVNYKVGDVNGDGNINTLDRMILSRYIAKWDGYEEQIVDMRTCDIDCNGSINTLDRMILARYLAMWDGYSSYFE